MQTTNVIRRTFSPATWVPSIYFMQGLPAAIVMQLSLVMYKQLGIDNATAVLLSSLFLLPWALKIFIVPLVERYTTKKTWVIATQASFIPIISLLIVSIGLPSMAITSSLVLILFGFASSTHDIASDGLYLLNLKSEEQAFFVGIKITAYQAAIFTVKSGVLFIVAAISTSMAIVTAWQIAFAPILILCIIAVAYHAITTPTEHHSPAHEKTITLRALYNTVLKIPNAGLCCSFILLFESAQIQLGKIVPLFMMDTQANGGLSLSMHHFALLYGTVGTGLLIVGALAGGFWISKHLSLRCLLPWTMIYALSHFIFVYLSGNSSQSFWIVGSLYSISQFIAGFINALYMYVLLKIGSQSQYKTTAYAFVTTIMLSAFLLFGMISGYIETWLGYHGFFIWIIILSLFIIWMTTNFQRQWGQS